MEIFGQAKNQYQPQFFCIRRIYFATALRQFLEIGPNFYVFQKTIIISLNNSGNEICFHNSVVFMVLNMTYRQQINSYLNFYFHSTNVDSTFTLSDSTWLWSVHICLIFRTKNIQQITKTKLPPSPNNCI